MGHCRATEWCGRRFRSGWLPTGSIRLASKKSAMRIEVSETGDGDGEAGGLESSAENGLFFCFASGNPLIEIVGRESWRIDRHR